MFIQTGFHRPMLLAAASVAFHSVALSQQTQTQSIHFQLTPAELPIATSHGTYKLSIAGAKGRDWVLGVVFDASRKPAIQLGQVLFGSPMHPGLMRPVSSVTSVQPSQIKLSSSAITINEFEGHALVGYMILPTNIQFELEVDGIPIYLTQASETLLIKNGALLPVPVRGLHTVMGQLYSSSSGKNEPKLTRTLKGTVFANAEAVKRNFLSHTKPQYQTSTLGVCCNNGGLISLLLKITELGDVSDVTLSTGDPSLADRAIAAARGWKFKPFQIEGKLGLFRRC